MKKYIISLFAVLFLIINAHSQSTFVNFQEEEILINGTTVNVGNTLLRGDLKKVKKYWIEFVKKHLQKTMKENDGVLVTPQSVVNQITDKRGDLMTYIYNKDNQVSLNMAYKLGYDVYLNSAQFPEEFEKMKEFMVFFVSNYYNNFLPGYIKQKEKSLKVLEKERNKAQKLIAKTKKKNKKLNKKNTSLEKKIEKYQTKSSEVKDATKKDALEVKTKGYEEVKNTNTKSLGVNNKVINSQQEIVSTLNPKIDKVTDLITSAKLTLIEVRSKMKTYE